MGGPYPILKLVIDVEEIEDGKTQVTENYIFEKGTVWRESTLKKSNDIFFKEIKKLMKKRR